MNMIVIISVVFVSFSVGYSWLSMSGVMLVLRMYEWLNLLCSMCYR